MATGQQKQEWLVIVPDHEGMLEERMKVRPFLRADRKHFEKLPPKLKDSAPCTYKVGGALLDEPVKEGGNLKMNGSFLLAVAETREEVIKTLREDIYTTARVWDWNRIEIHPVSRCPLRHVQNAHRRLKGQVCLHQALIVDLVLRSRRGFG
ncbi:MAG: hypothetical protein Q9217_002730 [Psora testacea]